MAFMVQRSIVHVLKGAPNPDTLNGVNKVVHNLATQQMLRGDKVEVWAISDGGAPRDYERTYPLRIFNLRPSRLLLDPAVVESVARCSPDTVFHLHSVFVPELFAISRVIKRQGLKWVISPHGGYAPESRRKNAFLKKLYMALFESRYMRGASAVHAIGTFGEADQFDPRYFEGKIGLVPNGQIMPDRYRGQPSPDGPLRIVFCGRLATAHKGLDLLLQGIKLAADNKQDVTLGLIGAGADRPALEAYCAQNGLNDRVTFHGAKLTLEKEALLLEADLFVHSSRWDVAPTAVLEAASYAIPVLVSLPTNLDGYVLAAGAGYVLNELTPEVIAEQVKIACEDKRSGVLAQKGLAARAMIATTFGWPGIAAQLEDSIYAKVSLRTIPGNLGPA